MNFSKETSTSKSGAFAKTPDVKGDGFTTGIINSVIPPKYQYRQTPVLSYEDTPKVAKTDGKAIRANEGGYFKAQGVTHWTYSATVDGEWTNRSRNPIHQSSRKPISVQVKTWGLNDASLYFHPEVATDCNNARERAGMTAAPVLKTECAIFDHLHHQHGYSVELSRDDDRKKEEQIFLLNVSAHLAAVDLNPTFQGDLLKYVKRLQKKGQIKQQRRLIVEGDTQYQDYRVTPFKVRLSNSSSMNRPVGSYRLAIRFVDTAGLCGQASYSAIAANAGHKLKYKDNFTSEEKSRMLDMAIERPEDFEKYSLGDLELDQILSKYDDRWREVYEKLGVLSYYREFKLTIGGTVKDLFTAVMAKTLGFVAEAICPITGKLEKFDWKKDWDEFEKEYLYPVSSKAFAENFKETKALLAKVQGGRCRNARPDVIAMLLKIAIDIDMCGCYGEGQRNQIYPIGRPEIWSYDACSKNNQYSTLATWLQMYQVKSNRNTGEIKDWGELIPGAWMARISTSEPLTFDQDLFESWMTPSGEHGVDLLSRYMKNAPSDSEESENGGSEFDVDYGGLKIFKREIHNAILTHDLLQLVITAPRAIRREFLKKVVVQASSVYPASQRIEIANGNVKAAFEELEEQRRNWKPRNYRARSRKGKVISNKHVEQECHAWIGLNLGELMIDDLLIQRKIAKLIHGKKSPQQTMFKLCVNTLYGDMVSKYFSISNPVVGNNITARARALAFCMEKGLQTIKIITDGGPFDPNRILTEYRFGVKPKSHHFGTLDPKGLMKLSWEKAATTSKGKDVYLATLKCEESGVTYFHHTLGHDDDGEPIALPNSSQFDEAAWGHLAKVFPTLDIFSSQTTAIKVKRPEKGDCEVKYVPRSGQFEFETKDVYDSAVFHGSANYKFSNPNGSNLKARGYESKRPHHGYEENGGKLTQTERYGTANNPVKDFFSQLERDPSRIERQIPAVKEGILKVGEYTKHSEKYDDLGLEPGDTIRKPLLFSEFSISAFTFNTYAQWFGWDKAISRTKIKKRQSLEMFFLNDDGTLDYQRMIEWVIDAIDRGVLDPFKELDASENRTRDIEVNHPHLDSHTMLRESLQSPFVEAEENRENYENYQNWVKEIGKNKPMETARSERKRRRRKVRFNANGEAEPVSEVSESTTTQQKTEPPKEDSDYIDPDQIVTRTRRKVRFNANGDVEPVSEVSKNETIGQQKTEPANGDSDYIDPNEIVTRTRRKVRFSVTEVA